MNDCDHRFLLIEISQDYSKIKKVVCTDCGENIPIEVSIANVDNYALEDITGSTITVMRVDEGGKMHDCGECLGWPGCDDGCERVSKLDIKDSGDRTQFDTGAVRDMHEGKGRMDLLPWAAIMELSKHCERGAIKYGERNIDKGIPQHSLMDSAFRHMAKYMEGMKDENHLVAAFWNLAWAVQFEATKPELQDVAARIEKVRANIERKCSNCNLYPCLKITCYHGEPRSNEEIMNGCCEKWAGIEL